MELSKKTQTSTFETIDRNNIVVAENNQTSNIELRKDEKEIKNKKSWNSFEQFKELNPQWYYKPPNNESWTKYFLRPYFYFYHYIKRLKDHLGWKFLILLTIVYFWIKGYLYQLLTLTQISFYTKLMNVNSIDKQIYSLISVSVWSMKSFFGLFLGIIQKHKNPKKYFILFVSVQAIGCYLLLGFFSFSEKTLLFSSLLFFGGNFQVLFLDLVTEVRYSELLLKFPEISVDVVSWVWFTYFAGNFLATFIVGPLGDQSIIQQNEWFLRGLFISCSFIAVMGLFPGLFDILGEVQKSETKSCLNSSNMKNCEGIFHFSCLITTSAIGLVVFSLSNIIFSRVFIISVYYKELPILIFSLLSTVLLCLFTFKVLPLKVAKANLYLFISAITYINISGAIDTFYLAKSSCLKDGPHFSQRYYMTWSGTIQSIFGIIGLFIFQKIMSNWEFRPCFWISTILQTLAGFIDIVIVERWNRSIGISDAWMYMFGYNIVYQVVSMLNFLPGIVLISKLCPSGMELIYFSLLAGFYSFGENISRSIGIYLIRVFKVELSDLGPCKVENFSLLILICHIVVPIVFSFPLSFFLIPKAKLSDEKIIYLEDNKNTKKESPQNISNPQS